ncbi:MAG: phenylacetic acid degradation-related protein [Firmicutes bacterium]|nr:phenylacetic acid degradation-related protein [Bacillota bacterium]
MTNSKKWLTEDLSTIYDQNSYMNLLGIRITKLDQGQSELSMPIVANKHTNLYHIAHGGALASLADAVMGIACATTGKQVVTIEMNINFIKSAVPCSEIKAMGKIIHYGKSTMIAEGEIFDSHNTLIAKTRGTFFITGKISGL